MGVLDVKMATRTPNLDCFLTRFNNGKWTRRPSRFLWYLRRGMNIAEARVRNKFGIEGRVARLVIEYTGPTPSYIPGSPENTA